MSELQTTRSSRKALLIGGGVLALAAGVVMFVLPAETGWDPTGVGTATGLVKIANPDNPALERGQARMETQEVLTVSDTAPAAEPGVTDSWDFELAPYEGIEFKYTIPQGARMAFHWEASGPLDYDMHGHPFDGGPDLTESFSIAEARVMQGTYIAPFTGIHGWFWQNRSVDTVTLHLEASGGMTTSTIFTPAGEIDRPLAGVENTVEGNAAGHAMQGAGPAPAETAE